MELSCLSPPCCSPLISMKYCSWGTLRNYMRGMCSRMGQLGEIYILAWIQLSVLLGISGSNWIQLAWDHIITEALKLKFSSSDNINLLINWENRYLHAVNIPSIFLVWGICIQVVRNAVRERKLMLLLISNFNFHSCIICFLYRKLILVYS